MSLPFNKLKKVNYGFPELMRYIFQSSIKLQPTLIIRYNFSIKRVLSNPCSKFQMFEPSHQHRPTIEVLKDTKVSLLVLSHFMPLVFFYIPWKNQKTRGFLMFSGDIEKDQWYKMGLSTQLLSFRYQSDARLDNMPRSFSNTLLRVIWRSITIVWHCWWRRHCRSGSQVLKLR